MRVLMIIKSTSEPFNFAARQSFDARSEMQIQFLLWIYSRLDGALFFSQRLMIRQF
jgi:hypothetical protein